MSAFFKKPIVLAIVIAIVIVIIALVSRGNKEELTTVTAARGTITQKVSVTGKVVPAEEVDLAFEKTGRVSRIAAKVSDEVITGQALAVLENAAQVAAVRQAEANVKTEEAKLAELRRGTRPEELKVQEVKTANARITLVDKLRDAYTKTDDAIRNTFDQFFDNPRVNPNLILAGIDTQLTITLERERYELEAALVQWNTSLAALTTASDLASYAAMARANLAKAEQFGGRIASAVNSLLASAKLSQTTIDGYKSDVSTARASIATGITNLTTAESSWIVEENQFTLKRAGATSEEIAAQEGKLAYAQAAALAAQAELGKTILRAPFAGIITRQDAKVGAIVAANQILVSIISVAEYEIEANVPEVDIAELKVGDEAEITLDAYGNGIVFRAKIIEIEPAETVVDGVPTYKTTFQFLAKNERIRSGMTANIEIVTAQKENVVVLPQRAIMQKNGSRTARVLKGKSITEIPVTLGARGSDGMVEIASGVSEGDIIYVPD